MALIECKECGKKVSNKAEVCIECGFPISKKKKNNTEEIKTQQKTRKSLKLQLLLSKIMMVLGAFIAYVYATRNDDIKSEIYLWVFVAGVVLYAVSKVRIWWNHS